MNSEVKNNIKQIATSKNYITRVYIGSNDDKLISTIKESLNIEKIKKGLGM